MTSEERLEINEINFPEPTFRKYVSDKIDTDNKGYITDEDCQKNADDIMNMFFTEEYKDLKNLEGIHQFIGVHSIDVSNTQVEELYLSSLHELVFVKANNTPNLQSMDLACTRHLEAVEVNNSGIQDIIITRDTGLDWLHASDTPNLKEVDFTHAHELGVFYAENSGIEKATFDKNIGYIGLDNCKNLKELTIRKEQIGCNEWAEDYSSDTTTITAKNTALENLDVSNLKELKELNISGTNIKNINLENNYNLENVDITNTAIKSLDISNNPKAKVVADAHVEITSLGNDIADIPAPTKEQQNGMQM